MKKHAIIVAGGKGSRMNSDIPKQFMELNGKPVLLYTLEAFYKYDSQINIILVLPENQLDYWQKMVIKHDIIIEHRLEVGGAHRFASVKKGLSNLKEGLVAIHDGVRPLVTQKVISDSFEGAENNGNAIAVVDVKDSIRLLSGDSSKSVDRSQYKVIQTPQTFEVKHVKQAYEQEYSDSFTDDASVLEAFGECIYLSEGDYSNIKITTQEDLIFAKSLLKIH